MRFGASFALFLVWVLFSLVAREAFASSASSSAELVRMAQEHERAREDDIAVRRYMEAVSIDPRCREAYLGLALLRERQGDLVEASKVFSVALANIPQFKEAFVGRARMLHLLHMTPLAADDIEKLIPYDRSVSKTLAGWYGEDGQSVAQLAVWRRIRLYARFEDDVALALEAESWIRALELIVKPADPVRYPVNPSPTRASLAQGRI